MTTETLGGFDDNRPESQGGYDPGVRSCYNTWHAYHPKPIAGTTSFYIEEQGPIQAWCGAIRLFATAAKNAGPNLNRRTFAEAMSKITNYPGTLSPVWSFGTNKFYGPTQYQVVKIHNNVPPSSQCKLKTNHKPQGTCWVTIAPVQAAAGLVGLVVPRAITTGRDEDRLDAVGCAALRAMPVAVLGRRPGCA